MTFNEAVEREDMLLPKLLHLKIIARCMLYTGNLLSSKYLLKIAPIKVTI